MNTNKNKNKKPKMRSNRKGQKWKRKKKKAKIKTEHSAMGILIQGTPIILKPCFFPISPQFMEIAF